MGVAKDIHEMHEYTDRASSIYVIFHNLGGVSRVVSPMGVICLYHERFPFLEFNRETCSKYCKTRYFAETYGPDLKHRREYQYIDCSVSEYYPVVTSKDGVSTFGCKQYMLKYEIYDTVMPTLIYHKSYETYVLILARMIGSTYDSYLFEKLYIRNLVRLGTERDIVGKVVEDYVDRINSAKEKCISDVSCYLESGRKLTNNFHSNLEKLKTSDIVVDGKLMLGNIEEGARLFDELAREIAVHGYSYVADCCADLLELVKIIRILGTSHDTACCV